MDSEYRCFHSRLPEQQEAIEVDQRSVVEAVVACQHIFGIGVYVPELDVWGHVNITAMGASVVDTAFANYPAIGTHVRLRALGRTPNGQLRLAVI